MPWINIWGISIPGYRLVDFVGGLGQLLRSADIWSDSESRLVLVPYIVPILAFVATIRTMAVHSAAARIDLLTCAAGVAPFVIFVYASTQLGGDFIELLSVGAYLTLVAAALLIVLGLVRPSPSSITVPTPTETASLSSRVDEP
jgi:hypothetical protein